MNLKACRKLVLLSVIVGLTGCVAGTGGSSVRPSARTSVEAPQETVAADSQMAIESGLQSILRERRRSDFPEIQTSEVGFTVTERVRISGSTFSLYEDALLALNQERYAQGIALLERITEEAPELTAPFVELGIAYSLTGDLKKAAAALETAAALSPEHPVVRNELGIVYRRSGRFREARAEYEKALAVFGDYHYARRNLAVLCDLYLADYPCALQHYRAYLDSAGDDPEVEIWVADLANRMGTQ